MLHTREISIQLALVSCLLFLALSSSACGHTDSEPVGSMNVSEKEIRTIASGEGIELTSGETYRLSLSPAAHLEERSDDCTGPVTHRTTGATTYETAGEQTACVVVYCASGCGSVEVQVEHLNQ